MLAPLTPKRSYDRFDDNSSTHDGASAPEQYAEYAAAYDAAQSSPSGESLPPTYSTAQAADPYVDYTPPAQPASGSTSARIRGSPSGPMIAGRPVLGMMPSISSRTGFLLTFVMLPFMILVNIAIQVMILVALVKIKSLNQNGVLAIVIPINVLTFMHLVGLLATIFRHRVLVQSYIFAMVPFCLVAFLWLIVAGIVGGPAALIEVDGCKGGCPAAAGLLGGAWALTMIEVLGTLVACLAMTNAANDMEEKSSYTKRLIKYRVLLGISIVLHALAIAVLIGLCVWSVLTSLGGLLALIVPIIVIIMLPLCCVMLFSGMRTAVRKPTEPDGTFHATLLAGCVCMCCMLCCLVAVFLGIAGLGILDANPDADCCDTSDIHNVIFALLICVVAVIGVFDWCFFSYSTNEEYAVVDTSLYEVVSTPGILNRIRG